MSLSKNIIWEFYIIIVNKHKYTYFSLRQLIPHEDVKGEVKSRIQRDTEDDVEVGWSIINEEVDTVIPLLLEHLQKLQIEHLQLPDIKENLSVVCNLFRKIILFI